jgi:PHD/YefM family antitoxin component YafN of YafNO toxin-antitoxin module
MATSAQVEATAASQVDLAELAAEIRRTGRPKVLTTGGSGDLVVLTLARYEELQEALDVALALLRGEADVAAGRVYSNEEAQEYLRAAIKEATNPPGTER